MIRRDIFHWTSRRLIIAALFCGLFAAHAWAKPAGDDLVLRRSRASGMATFVARRDADVIAVDRPAGADATRPTDFLRQYGSLFGVKDPAAELREAKSETDRIGQTHTTFRQVFRGVPVFAGTLKIHQDSNGEVLAANGEFRAIPQWLDTTPVLTAQAALGVATAALGIIAQPTVERNDLLIVDPGWYGDPPIGPHLAYHIIVSDAAAWLREAFFIDARTGRVLDRWSLMETVKNRVVYSAANSLNPTEVFCRGEDEPPGSCGGGDVDRAYDYTGDFYDFIFRMFGRDGPFDAPGVMTSTVHWDNLPTSPPNPNDFCPNAFYNGSQTFYCTNVASDDIVAHEWGHALTAGTANLIYENQSGQLNEHYSDVWGELIDLFNGDVAFAGPPGGPAWPSVVDDPGYFSTGTDTPNNLRTTATPPVCSPYFGTDPINEEPFNYPDGVRWLLTEDSTTIHGFGGPLRDMWEPTCSQNAEDGTPCCPERANHPWQLCQAEDQGGVHSGSGVPNHAFAMLVDGKSFNGYDVAGIGPIKAAAVWYRALSYYLIETSDFSDAYMALNRSAQDLVGTTPLDPRTGLPWDDPSAMFTQFDAQQVDFALLAVEMDTDGLCGASSTTVLSPDDPNECMPRNILFEDDFETGAPGWTVENNAQVVPYDWVLRGGDLPLRGGTAWFINDPRDCAGDPSLHSLISPPIVIPNDINDVNRLKMSFTHLVATKAPADGGNVKISVDGAPWELVDPNWFEFNWYNSTIQFTVPPSPLAAERAWVGVSGPWGTSVVDLSDRIPDVAGTTIRVRFDFGKDGCEGYDGWYVDDFKIYVCSCGDDAFCDDGVFCNGAETCAGGWCVKGDDPCQGNYCDGLNDQCVASLFWDDFENGNAHGWLMDGPDDTATAGTWEIGDPVGTFKRGAPSQPENGAIGAGCAFTAQNPSGIATIFDVNNGTVYLVSPTIDLSGHDSATLSFYRWFYQEKPFDGQNDSYTADVSDDDGATWTTLETVGPTTFANTWTPVSFDLAPIFNGVLTSTMRVRFAANALGAGRDDLVEAAVDEVVITVPGVCLASNGDADGNCVVDLADYAAWSGCLSGPGVPYQAGCDVFDFDVDNDVDMEDMQEFLAAFGAP